MLTNITLILPSRLNPIDSSHRSTVFGVLLRINRQLETLSIFTTGKLAWQSVFVTFVFFLVAIQSKSTKMGDPGSGVHAGEESDSEGESPVAPPPNTAPPINPYPQPFVHARSPDPDLFSPQKWRRVATNSLLHATKAVDQLCHAIVSTKPSFSGGHLAAEIRRLALTVAVFERSLFAYALRIQRQLAIADEAESAEVERPHVSRPLSVGWKKAGMVSLLQMLTRTLNSTTILLNSLTNETSFFKYVRNTRAWFLLPIILLLRHRLSDGVKGILSEIVTRFPGLEPLMKLVERFALTRYGVIPLTLYCLYRRAISNRCKILKHLHTRLNILLTLWHICVSVIDQEELGDNSGDQVAISQWMLELVPPSLDTSFWYQSTWQLSLVKYGMDVVYSSVSQWYNLFGDRIIGYPFLSACFLYYSHRPAAAARRCSTILGSPDIRFISTAWKTHDTYLLPRLIWWYNAYVRPFLRLSPRIVIREIMLTHDYPNSEAEMLRRQSNRKRTIKVLLLSGKVLDLSINTKLRASMLSTARNMRVSSSPVIIYLHGGGWVNDFRYCTLTYLKRWAIKTGAPILFVDYTLATESAYPAALEECYDVFKWVADGRLGIHPSSIILAADSTGKYVKRAETHTTQT